MNPILLGKQVEEGLRELVRSSFETTSAAYAGMIDNFLAQPENFLKGPWLSVDLPFRAAESTAEYFPEVPLGFHAHRHQELAFRRLRHPSPRSTLVATGTGSGKTESFLWPILDACREAKAAPGVKAIIIYPMNALATDQARRIARAIARIPALSGVRCGIYADAEPAQPSDVMTENDVITSRRQMLSDPPDILLTNYKMLDLLLLRGTDKPLWARNEPQTLKYLVVDELHTFDGAQGADLALLIRRLKARLETPSGHLACIGSSATLGAGAEAATKLLRYANDLFGEPFEADAVIREDRLAIHEYLSAPDYIDLPPPHAVLDAVSHAIDLDQGEAAGALAQLFFDDLPADPEAIAYRMALGTRLKQHIVFHRVIEALQAQGRAALLNDVVSYLSATRLFRGTWSEAALAALVEATIILTAWARSGDPARPSPLLNVRVQTWGRELRRMVASVPSRTPAGELVAPVLHHSDDLEPLSLLRTLPVIHCGHCGATGQVGRLTPTGGGIGANLDTIYEEFFDGGSSLRFFYFDPLKRLNAGRGYGAVIPGYINPETLACEWRPHTMDADDVGRTPIWMFDPIGDDGRVDRTCPSCGTKHGLQILGLRSARLAASLSTSLFNSQHHESDPNAKPRVLVFSDSVQDAAQRAAVSEIRNAQIVFRKALYRSVANAPDQNLALDALISTSIPALRRDLGEARFVARHIARDQTWRKAYTDLAEGDREPDTPGLGDDVALRLGWEFFSDLTYRSRTSQTLETARLAIADVATDDLASAALDLVARLPVEMGQLFALEEDDAFAFLWGLCTHLRRSGAVTHPYVATAAAHATNRLNYFAARRVMGVHRLSVLPTPDQRTSAAPMLPTLRANADGFTPVGRDSPTNWYRAWANRFFAEKNPLLATNYGDLFACAFQTLERRGLLTSLDGAGADPIKVWALAIEAVTVSTRVETRSCNQCGRRETTLPIACDARLVCLRIGCEGELRPGAHAPSVHMQRVMETARNHRVVAREHTGILEADARRALEAKFISGEQPWHPNLISATPTLEMGIDIGDLSTLILASMPPEEANYVQRIGRTGRRDGNSFNVTLIAARPHDLQFWEEPSSMLMGEVAPPGVHLQAVAVLKRQAAAFALDHYVAATATPVDYGIVSSAIATLERSVTADFPLHWFHHLATSGQDIADRFIALLPEDVRERPDLVDQLRRYILEDGEDSLRYRVRRAFTAASQERAELMDMRRKIDNDRTRLKRAAPAPKDLDEQLERLTRKRSEISNTIRETIDRVGVLKFLTDRGLLPNYAFPEEGVKLKAFIIKSAEQRLDDASAENDLLVREYVRPASSALTELAPHQTFYAEGRQLTIDRLELRGEDVSTWRFCPRCVYTESGISAGKHQTCPKCREPMWSDLGAEAETVELRTVIASSTEQKAAIRDLDDRASRTYDRYLSPSYDSASVEYAYVLSDDTIGAPFGYEFVPACEFRDLNFGVKTNARMGRTIAGDQRQSRPFPICRHCGKLQFDQNGDGDHQARCPADAGREPRTTWEALVYLMRRFTTEALRLIVPVAGRADEDDIKSFVAGIELGLRKHFAGRVDHLRNAVIEERLTSGASVRNLYLFDNIPGGSGYLRQLASDPRTMHRVFQLSANALRGCPCAEDTAKDGCFRCVKGYRSHFGAGEPRRSLALQLVEAILAGWDSLTPAHRPIDDVLGADLVESELEARFLEALRRAFPQNLKPLVLESGRRGYQLKINLPAHQEAYWLIEPQVQMDERYPGLPRRRVDFLFTSKTSPDLKPIVVELDGWEFHARSIARDLEDRLRMIRSGQVEVWTLTWADLEGLAHSRPIANPFAEGSVEVSVEGALGQLWAHPRFAALRAYRRPVERLRESSSLEAFLERLNCGAWSAAEAVALMIRLCIGQNGTPISALAGIDFLTTDARLFLEETQLHGRGRSGDLSVFFGAPHALPEAALAALGDFRFVVHAAMVEDPAARLLDLEAQHTWRSLWRLINLVQDLSGLHVLFPSLDTLDTPATRRTQQAAGAVDGAWDEVAALLDDDMRATLNAIRQAGAPIPDMTGEDFVVGDSVVGMVEFGWRAHELCVTAQNFKAAGWEILEAVSPNQPGYSHFIERVLAALQRESP